MNMSMIKEKQDVFLKLINDTVTDISGENTLFTLTDLKISYCFEAYNIRINLFYNNDKLERTDQKNNIISFLVTPENKLTDVYVNFGNGTNFNLNKEVLKEIDIKVKEKLSLLFKKSDLTYVKVRVLTGNKKKESFDKFLDLINVIFEDCGMSNLVLNGEVYSIPSGILIRLILENNDCIDCCINRDNGKVSVPYYNNLRFNHKDDFDFFLGTENVVSTLDEKKENLYNELEKKIPYLLENSKLNLEELDKIAQQMAEKRADLNKKKLAVEQERYYEKVKTPSETFQKFKDFEELLNEFLQKIAESYDGLQIAIKHIEYLYPAKVQVFAKTKDTDILGNQYSTQEKIINFDMSFYGESFSISDVEVSLEKCSNDGFYKNLQEENIKVKEMLPKLLCKVNLHSYDIKEWTSFEYQADSQISIFANRLYAYLSKLDVIDSELLQYMYFGCQRKDNKNIVVEVFQDTIPDEDSLLTFNISSENDISVVISNMLVKDYKRIFTNSYHRLLDTLDVIKNEIVFLLDNCGINYNFWDTGLPLYPSEDGEIDLGDFGNYAMYSDRVHTLDYFYDVL